MSRRVRLPKSRKIPTASREGLCAEGKTARVWRFSSQRWTRQSDRHDSQPTSVSPAAPPARARSSFLKRWSRLRGQPAANAEAILRRCFPLIAIAAFPLPCLYRPARGQASSNNYPPASLGDMLLRRWNTGQRPRLCTGGSAIRADTPPYRSGRAFLLLVALKSCDILCLSCVVADVPFCGFSQLPGRIFIEQKKLLFLIARFTGSHGVELSGYKILRISGLGSCKKTILGSGK